MLYVNGFIASTQFHYVCIQFIPKPFFIQLISYAVKLMFYANQPNKFFMFFINPNICVVILKGNKNKQHEKTVNHHRAFIIFKFC